MGIRQIANDAMKDHGWTWAGHAWTSVMIPALLTAIVGIFVPLDAISIMLSYLVLVTCLAIFYARREYLDHLAYEAKGTYRKAQGHLDASVDKTGDSLGPFTAWTTALMITLLLWNSWMVIVVVTITFVFLIKAMFHSAQVVRARRERRAI